MSTTLTPLDFVLLGLYLAGTLGVGLWIGRSIRTGEDFFLGGLKLPWWAIGMSGREAVEQVVNAEQT